MRPTRRQLLGAASLVVLTGCTDAAPPVPPPVDPDDALRAAAVARERELLASYDAVLLTLPALAPRLVALRAEHSEHLAALAGAGAGASPASDGPAPRGQAPRGQASSGPAAPGPPAVPPPATAAAALAGLAEAERAAAAAHATDVVVASRPLAALLASLAASEASHPVVLA